MRFFRVTDELRPVYQERIAGLEAIASYPLGEDSFKIDHGRDYFAFFDRLGEVHYHIAVEGERVVAVAAGVLRRIPRKAWYLCDLKVHPDFRGQRLPLKMLTRAFFPNYVRCARGYLVTMNPAGGKPNRVVKLVKNFRLAPMSVGPQLGVYSLDAEAMARVSPMLDSALGPVSFLSLKGCKELVLASTGKPLPLLHAQFGSSEPGLIGQPQPGHTHMFCLPETDALAGELARGGVRPSATASIVHHRMGDNDWRFIRTSDI